MEDKGAALDGVRPALGVELGRHKGIPRVKPNAGLCTKPRGNSAQNGV